MADDKNVAMFIERNGEKVQVGWATPLTNGVRSTEFLAGFEDIRAREVFFDDDNHQEETSEVEGVEETDEVEEVLDAEPIEETPDEELAAEPVENVGETLEDEPVELDNGGDIVDVADESDEDDEEAEFQRQLEEERARFADDAPQTRREAREQEDN